MAPVNRRMLAAAQVQQAQRAMAQQRRGVQLGNMTAIQAERAGRMQQANQNAERGAAGPTDWKALVAQRDEKMGRKPQGGGGGLVGNIIKTAAVPLQALDIGRRIVLSGMKEGADWVGNPGDDLFGNKTDEASWSDFMSQVKDPEFGFGTIVGDVTGNKWIDRGIGLFGDIATDPLTYLTLGANKIPGAMGRMSLAAEAAGKQLPREVVEAAGRGGARSVRRLGDEAAIEALNLPEAGLRFGTRKANVRIPGTATIENVLQDVLMKTRSPFIDSRAAQGLRRFGVARQPGLRPAIEGVLTGRGDVPAQAVEWGSEQAALGGSRAVEGTAVNTAEDIARKLRSDPAFTHALESGDLSHPMVAKWNEMNQRLYSAQAEQGVSMGPAREFYAPHILTNEGAEAFGHAAPAARGGAQDVTRAEASQFSRQIVPGEKYTIQGKVFEPVEGTIKEANDWGKRELGIKLYEDRPDKLAAIAVERARSASYRARKFDELKRAGMVAGETNPIASRLDMEATRIASKGAAETNIDELQPMLQTLLGREGGSQVDEAAQALRAYNRGAMNAQRRAYGEAYGAANEAQAAFEAAARGTPDVSEQIAPLAQQLSGARAAERAARGPVEQLEALASQGLEGPRMLEPRAQALAEQFGGEVDEWTQVYRNLVEQGATPPAPVVAEAAQEAVEMPADVAAQIRRLEGQARRAERAGGQVADVMRLQEEVANLRAPYEVAATPGVEAVEQLAPEVVQEQAIARANAAQRQLNMVYRKGRYQVPVEGAPLPEAEPLQQALEAATGTRKSLEEQLTPLLEQQGRRNALGEAPDVDKLVAEQVQPRLSELEAGRAPFQQWNMEAMVNDLERGAQTAEAQRALDARLERLPEEAQAMIRQVIADDSNTSKMDYVLDQIRQGKLDDQIVREANEGWQRLATDRIIGGDVYIREEMQAAMEATKVAMDRFNAAFAKEPGMFGKVIDSYTQFFKSWATATPGFHIRNALSATFMNLTEGVGFMEMLDGRAIWKTFRDNAMDPNWTAKLPKRLQGMDPKVAQNVVEAVYASGAGGRYTAAEVGKRAFNEGSKLDALTDIASGGRLTQKSRNVGERIEGDVRAGLALHAIGRDGSGSVLDATQRIKRVHFDYSDVNEVDRTLRRIIPFWTFMSRNLPLQIQQMILRPKTYAQFNSVMRNINDDPNGERLMPSWAQNIGGTFISPGTILTPDVGATQISQTLEQLTNPRKLATTFTPPLKTAIELGTNTDLYYGSRYKENDFQKVGGEMSWLNPLLEAIGVAESTPQGTVMEKKYNQAIRDNLPLLATFNRLGSTTTDREGKGLGSWLRFFGLPISQVNPDQALNDRRSAYFDRKDAEARMQALAQFGGAA